jgi:hypothetical protein
MDWLDRRTGATPPGSREVTAFSLQPPNQEGGGIPLFEGSGIDLL